MASDQLCVDTIRCVSAALSWNANSGHPGAPMGCAAMAHVLYSKIMRQTASNPKWFSRDFFVLSNGHACSLQYLMLHLCGYDVSLEDLKQFRQLNSKLPGHPERGCLQGIEVTTGPLGQGVAQAVGLTIAKEMMIARFNKPDLTLIEGFVYAILGDGCLQEGVASEACSLAGCLGLGRLICLYDHNSITIDGATSLSFQENVELRFKAYGWEVLSVSNATTDTASIEQAILKAQKNLTQPTLIICETIIGYGSQKQGTKEAHGAPLTKDDLLQCRRKFNVEGEDLFWIPEQVRKHYESIIKSNEKVYTNWNQNTLQQYREKYPSDYAEFERRSMPAQERASAASKLLSDLGKDLSCFKKSDSTRALSGQVLNQLVKIFPEIVGGSADLTSSNCTALKETAAFSKTERAGRYIYYGVREHAMVAITNGISAHEGFRPFCASFLNFITYAWGAVRLGALSHLPNLYIMTHDSIELGEDGPTHQPIEVAALCRATPNLYYFRPADINEVIAGYKLWLEQIKTPVVLALCRSGTPTLEMSSEKNARMHGGYVVQNFNESTKIARVILGASGTEVALCISAAKLLETEYNVRVVSMPCWDILEKQESSYIDALFPSSCKTSIYVETANVIQYNKYFKHCIHLTDFGVSAPKQACYKHFEMTPEDIAKKVRFFATK